MTSASWWRPARHRLLVPIAALLFAALAAGPARADIGITSFSVTPSTTQAGIPSTTSGPDLRVDTKFSSANSDSPNLMTLSLAPGLVQDPQVVDKCTAQQFQFDQCSASSQIGSGWTTATAPGAFGFTDAAATSVYLITPQGSEPARIGVIVNFYGWPIESATAPVTPRTATGDAGLDYKFAGLPNLWNGVSIVVDEMDLTIWGKVDGKIFTRNPTSCRPAVSRVSAVSYGNPGATAHASSTFTPTGCDSLAYAPKLAAAIQLDKDDDGAAFGTEITQSEFESATQSLTLSVPASLTPRFSALGAACTAADARTCPSVGWASSDSPILSAPITGKIVFRARPGGLPSPAIVFDPPFSFELDSTTAFSGSTLMTTFADQPDLPLTNLTVVFAGGADSLFKPAGQACVTPAATTGAFVGQSGATAQLTVGTQVLGCPGFAGSSGTSTSSGASSGGSTASGSPSATGYVDPFLVTALKSHAHPVAKKHKKHKKKKAKHKKHRAAHKRANPKHARSKR
jgi:hypothetical protein